MTQPPHEYLYNFLSQTIALETMILLPTEEEDDFSSHPGRQYFKLVRSLENDDVYKAHLQWMAEEAVALLVAPDPRIKAGLKAIQEGTESLAVLLGLKAVLDYFRPYPGEEGPLETLAYHRLISTVASILLDIIAPTLVTEPIRCFSRAFQYEDISEYGTLNEEAKLKGWKLALADLTSRTSDW